MCEPTGSSSTGSRRPRPVRDPPPFAPTFAQPLPDQRLVRLALQGKEPPVRLIGQAYCLLPLGSLKVRGVNDDGLPALQPGARVIQQLLIGLLRHLPTVDAAVAR